MPSTALNPHLNLRLFAAGHTASAVAAAAWMGGSVPPPRGAWTALLDSLTSSEREALGEAAESAEVDTARHETRVRISGSPAQLFDLSGSLLAGDAPHLGTELRAACSAFEASLYRRERTLVMGILNVTPDSFSDGGQWPSARAAVEGALRMVEEGADIIDIGGESTRPGAEEISVEAELQRVLPVVERLREATNALISIDTRKSAVAEACLEAGADWVNDVSGLTHDPELAYVVAAHPGTTLVLMHSRKRPGAEVYSHQYDPEGRPVYDDVVADTLSWLRAQVGRALEAGIPAESLWLDPGFGFGKTPPQNIELLRRLREYTAAGLPILVGTSRKSTIGHLLGGLPASDRLEGTAATVSHSIAAGAAAVRVHDVREMARVARVADALR
ncbi:MAG: dihydropteroate synthase [Armatimonadota bacterium]